MRGHFNLGKKSKGQEQVGGAGRTGGLGKGGPRGGHGSNPTIVWEVFGREWRPAKVG